MIALSLAGCVQYQSGRSYDRGMQANLQAQAEYAQFRKDNPCWNPNQNPGYIFDPESGGWEIRKP